MMRFTSKLWLVVTLAALHASSTLAAEKLLGSSFGLPADAAYDYVIVGGGTAGLTMASRLAANFSVAVIEAGSFYEITNSNYSQVPLFCPIGSGKSPESTLPFVDWQFQTTPQAGFDGASVHYARGKCLGGSSARNYLAYHVSSSGAYDRWANLTGDSSYNFRNFQEYFQKSQNFSLPPAGSRPANATPAYNASSLGTSGPLSVTFPPYAFSFSSWAQQALQAIGVPPIEGFTSGNLLGSSYILLSEETASATRESSETSYLRKLGLPSYNLIVYQQSLATKIVFNGTTATGVEVTTSVDGYDFTLTANKEIIVSAGAFQSPQLLMVSGVGPQGVLGALDIPVVKDLAGVGQNLQDHILGGPSYRVDLTTTSTITTGPAAAEAIEQYLNDQTGPLTDIGTDFLAFEKLPSNVTSAFNSTVKTALATLPSDWPHIEYLLTSAFVGYQENPLTTSPDDGYNYATVSVALVAPFSRGNISISSGNMQDPPVINPNWLTSPVDTAVAVAGYKRARQVFANMPQVLIGPEYFPGANVTSDAEILAIIRQSFATVSHASCTCKMGLASDSLAVLDNKARIFGVQNLRVVDSSAFPILPPGHPQSSVYALAEKIAEDILSAA